jgi:hypothetical protein
VDWLRRRSWTTRPILAAGKSSSSTIASIRHFVTSPACRRSLGAVRRVRAAACPTRSDQRGPRQLDHEEVSGRHPPSTALMSARARIVASIAGGASDFQSVTSRLWGRASFHGCVGSAATPLAGVPLKHERAVRSHIPDVAGWARLLKPRCKSASPGSVSVAGEESKVAASVHCLRRFRGAKNWLFGIGRGIGRIGRSYAKKGASSYAVKGPSS